MKILSLRLSNLNSLASAAIDFTKPPLAGCGLFAITGPTGAGKTTLLDAITLALYGRAARYDHRPDDMMSRHTGECSAEVEFQTPKGSWRASWHLRRAGGKPEGKLQPAVRRVVDLKTGTIVERKVEADALIVELTGGLDYQSFLRSVLLAQGQFAAFLRAKGEDRSRILEKITATEIYTELSREAYLAKTEAEEKVKYRELRLEAVKLLSTEERQTKVDQLAQAKAQAEALSQLLEAERKALQKMEQLLALRKTLLAAQNAESLLAPAAQEATTSLTQTQQQRDLVVAHLAQLQPDIDRAVQLDEQLLTQQRMLADRQSSVAQATKQVEQLEQQVKALHKTESESAARLTKGREWIEAHGVDAILGDQLPQLRLLAEGWEAAEREWQRLIDHRERAAQIRSRQQTAEKLASQAKLAETTALSALKTTQEQLESARSERVAQEKIIELATRVMSLAQHRPLLQEGQPCPLCGALAHPWASGEGADLGNDHAQAVKRREALDRLMNDLTLHHRKLTAEHAAAQKEAETQSLLSQELAKDLISLAPADDSMLATQRNAAEQAKRTLQQQLSPVSIILDDAKALSPAFAELEKRASTYRKAHETLLELQREVTNSQQSRERLQPLLQEALLQKEKAVTSHQEAVSSVETLRQTRSQVLSGSTVAAVRSEQAKRLEIAEQALLSAQQRHQKAHNQWLKAQAEVAAAQTQLNQLSQDLEDANAFTEEHLAQQRSAFAHQQQAHETLLRDSGRWEQELTTDTSVRSQQEADRQLLQTEREAAGRWQRLSALIGSADGKAFRSFAQSLTLVRLVGLANARLERLNPRYRLRPTPGTDLELEIIDLNQAAVARPLASLSGGETFLVSLALALGLSDMASTSRNVPIESLFIDEGFGTLDPDTMEIALDALDALQASGKTIGVISHLPSLKERITTQIQVDRGADGRSRLVVKG